MIGLDLVAFEFLSQFLNRKPLEPLMPIACVIASSGSVTRSFDATARIGPLCLQLFKSAAVLCDLRSRARS